MTVRAGLTELLDGKKLASTTRVTQRGDHTHGRGVGLGVEWAGQSVEGVATDAAASFRVLFVQQDADRQVERLDALRSQARVSFLHAWLMAHRRPGVWVPAGRL